MVAAVVGIRLRTAAHLMRREWWRALMTGFGALWMVLMLPSLFWAQAALVGQDAQIRADAVVAMVAVATVGWAVVPVVVSGLDDTLDPSRFRALAVEVRAIMPGLVVAALLTLPAVFFALAFAMLTAAWRPDGAAVVVVAGVGLVLTLLSLVVVARVSAAWAGRVLASRRAKALATLTALLLVAGLVLAVRPLAADGLTGFIDDYSATLLTQLGVTPLGAGAAAPGAAAQGDWWGAAWRLGVQAAWLGLLVAAWRATVSRALVSPPSIGTGTRRRRDAILDPRVPLLVRDGATAAVRARTLRAWVSDPRYVATLAGVFLLPVFVLVMVVPVFDLDRRWSYVVPVILAVTLGWGRHNDVAFDSSALWLDVVSGRVGRAVMRGRFGATLSWTGPLVVTAAIAVVVWLGTWADLPGLLGATVGTLGLSLGVSAMSAVVVPYRAPAPGHSPFGAEVGSIGAGMLAQLGSSAVAFVLLPLVIVPFMAALVVAPGWGAVSAVMGVALGVAGYVGGVHLAGGIYDKRAGTLLAAVA